MSIERSEDRIGFSVKKKTLKITAIAIAVISVLMAVCVAVPLSVAFAKMTGTPSTEVWDSSKAFDENEDAITLWKEDPNKDFKILNLADVQMADSYTVFQNNRNYDMIAKVVEQEKPDLITLTGDNVWLINSKSAVKRFVKEMDSLGVPWAPVFGNHDSEFDVDKNWLVEQYLKSDTCLMRKGPKNIAGVGNYIINVKDRQTGKIIQTLFMMDSLQYNKYEEQDTVNVYPGAEGVESLAGTDGWLRKDGYTFKPMINDDGSQALHPATNRPMYEMTGRDYDYIKQNQIDWYKWAVKGIAELTGEIVPSSAFFHIPLPEFDYAYSLYEKTITDAEGNLFDEEKLKELEMNGAENFGANREAVSCPTYNSGFFEVMYNLGSTKNVVVGHDHVNNSSIVYRGIRLTFALKTGDGCYWDESGKVSGGTTITVDGTGATVTKHVYMPFE